MPTVIKNDIDNTSAQLVVTITKDEIKPKVESELKRIRQKADIKGFRHGHAPMSYIKKMYGTSVLVEMFNEMMSQEVFDYLRSSKLDVLGQPLPAAEQKQYEFKVDQMDDEYAVTYDIGFVAPFEFKELDNKDTFERLVVSNLDELIDEDLEHARTSLGERINAEDNIEEKDLLKVHAKEVKGDYEHTFSFLVESIPDDKLKKQFLKLKLGDSIKFDARKLEEDKGEKHFRKYILGLEDSDEREVSDQFEGTIEEVSRVVKAELNEDFFSKYFGNNEVTTIEQAREKIGEAVKQFYDVRSNALLMRDFQEKIMEQNTVELPEAFLKRWLLVSNEGKITPDDIDRQYPAFADNLRWTMLRDKMKALYNLAVSEEELRGEYLRRIQGYFQGQLPEDMLGSYIDRMMQDEQDVNNTRETLETDKIFEAVREKVKIKDKGIPSSELHELLDKVSRKAQEEQSEDAELREVVAE
jgi:trigger factor